MKSINFVYKSTLLILFLKLNLITSSLDIFIGNSSVNVLDCDGSYEKPYKNLPHAFSKLN